ncbi:MAG: helix-turn-helix domain-containing protein [Acidobacteriaceae bacterium]
MHLNLIEELETRQGAMKVADLTKILGVDDKHIYRMAARGQLPSFHVGGAVRFDPQEVAKWLRLKYRLDDAVHGKPPARIRPARTDNQHVA